MRLSLQSRFYVRAARAATNDVADTQRARVEDSLVPLHEGTGGLALVVDVDCLAAPSPAASSRAPVQPMSSQAAKRIVT